MQEVTGGPGHLAVAGEAIGNELLVEESAAQYVKLSVHSLRKFRQQGGGPAYVQLSKQRIAYRRRDLDTWIGSRIVHNTVEGGRVGGRDIGLEGQP